MQFYANLHTHSSHSDGQLSPEQLAKAAKAEGYSALAITDHDVATAWQELKSVCDAEAMECIFGVEFSAPSTLLQRKNGTCGHFHITGYHFNPEYPPMKAYLEGMSLRQTHQTRVLFEWGVAEGKLTGITWDEVVEYNAGKTWLCNEQLFRALMAKGLAVRADHPRFFRELFGKRRGEVPPAYDFEQAHEIIDLIRSAGGIAILAHPHRQLHLVEPLMEMGIEGIEVWHPDLEPQEQEAAYKLALEKGLYISGGTDHYGPCDNAYENYPDPKDCPYYMEPQSAGTTYEHYIEIRDRKISR